MGDRLAVLVVACCGATMSACATSPTTYEDFAARGGFRMSPIPSPQRMAEMGQMLGGPVASEPPLAEPLGPEFYLSASGDPSLGAELLGEWAQRYAAERTIARGYAYYVVTALDSGMGVDNMRAVGDMIAFDEARYLNMMLVMLPADADIPEGAIDAASALATFEGSAR